MTTVFRGSIPYGYSGSMATLARMRSIVRQSLSAPAVIEAAHRIIAFLPPRQQTRQAYAIREVLGNVFQFVADPKGVELLRTPVYQLGTIKEHGVSTGDCDDAAILGAALGMAVGISARFRVIAFRRGGDFAHVYAILTPNDGPAIDLDVTKPTTGAAAPVRFQDYPI